MELWPGNPSPPGATWDGQGTNFALFTERATSVELCLFDDDRLSGPARPAPDERRDPPAADRGRRPRVARLRPRGDARPALRLPGPRPVGPRTGACASTRPSCSSTPTPWPSTAASTGTRPSSATARGGPDDQPRPPRLRPPRPPVGGGRHPLPVGRRHPPPHPVARHRDLRAARQGVHRPPPRRARPACGAPTPAWPARR